MTDILLVGGTGRVGAGVAAHLDEAGLGYAVGSSRPDAARHRFADVRHADLRRPETLAEALDGITVAFLVTPLGPDETDCGMAFLDAAAAAGVRKIVYVAIMNIDAMTEIPHFATKAPIRDRLLADGPHVVADANFFMQNDAMVAPVIGQGVYPLPIGSVGVNSVDARDVSAVCARALTSDALDGRAVPVCGGTVVTGASAADAYAKALGRPVRYGGDDVEAFSRQMAATLPPMPAQVAEWIQEDFRLMMAVTQAEGCLATPEQLSECEAALGRPPRRYQDFVAELSAGL